MSAAAVEEDFGLRSLMEEKSMLKGKKDKIIEDPKLLCPLCQNVYTDPKLLNCMHTFCLVCLQPHLTKPEPADNQCEPPDAANAQAQPDPQPAQPEQQPAKPEEPPAPAKPEEPPAPAQPEEPPAPAKPEEPPAPAQPEEPPAPAKPEEPPAPVQPPEKPKPFVTCPTCKEQTEITTTIEALDNNYQLQNLIEVLQSEKRGGPKCKECTENNDVKYYCVDCPLSMCEKCYEFHKRQTMFVDHRIKPSSAVLPAQLIRGHRDYCKQPRHNSQLLYFCTECEVNICIHCPNSKAHKDHKYVFIDNMLEERKDEVDGMVNKGNQACGSIKSFLDVSQQMLHNTRVEKDKSVQIITETFDKVQNMLTQQKEKLIKQIADNYEDGKQSLDKARKQADVLRSLLEYCATANDMADQVGNIVVMTDLMNLLERQFKRFDINAIDTSSIPIPPDAAIQNNPASEVFGIKTTDFKGNKGNIQVGIQKKAVTVTDPLFQTSLENLKKAMELFAQN